MKSHIPAEKVAELRREQKRRGPNTRFHWRTTHDQGHPAFSLCSSSHGWDCLLWARGRGRWRPAVWTVNTYTLHNTRLKKILATNLLMDLLESLQWFFIEIICYRSAKVYRIFKTGCLIMIQIFLLSYLSIYPSICTIQQQELHQFNSTSSWRGVLQHQRQKTVPAPARQHAYGERGFNLYSNNNPELSK